MKCIRAGCTNEAIISPTYGVLPCEACQKKDSYHPTKKYEFANLSKTDRIQTQRDHHLKDLIQPYWSGKPNPEYARAYPSEAHNYFKKSELTKI